MRTSRWGLLGASFAIFFGAILALVGCGKGGGDAVEIPTFGALVPVASAPPAIARAARKVVLVDTPNGFGTGFFVSPNGILVTNNHVLGADNADRRRCAAEGCYATLFFDYAKGSTYRKQEYFLSPIKASRTLDVALFQVWEDKAAGKRLATPAYFDLTDAVDPVDGSEVFAVGHPGGTLKRYSAGTVTSLYGHWFDSTNFTLPGNSGSPMIDGTGRLVGILHRSAKGHGHVRRKDVRTFTSATKVMALAAFMAGRPVARSTPFVHVRDERTRDEAAALADVYRLAKKKDVLSGKGKGETVPMLEILQKRCKAQLDREPGEYDDFFKDHAACYDALQWLNCRDTEADTDFKSCPAGDDKTDWQKAFDALADKAFEAHVANPLQTAIASSFFEKDEGEREKRQREKRQREKLLGFLDRHRVALSPQVAFYLLDAGVETRGGVDLKGYLLGYRTIRGYDQDLENVIRGVLLLFRRKALGRGLENGRMLDRFAAELLADPALSLDDRFFLEEELYLEGR